MNPPHVPAGRIGPVRTMGLVLMAAGLLSAALPAGGATIYANPGDDLNAKISAMNPGDTLILNPGVHTKASGTMMLITSKVGNENAWFVIRAEQPGTVRILGNSGKNMCEMRNSAYWRFENLELDGRNLSDDGIKATINTGNPNTDWNHHVVIDNVHMHNLTNAAISTLVTVWDLTVRNCWLHDCGLAGYLGSPDHVQQIINLTFENNLVERTYGYGVQVKAQNPRSGLTLGTTPGLEFTSWGWSIKNNVWMRTSPPASTARPNLLVDAAPASGVGSDDLATIEGNVVLAQTVGATSDYAFQLSGNIRLVNNILMNAKEDGLAAIRFGFHDITYPRRVEIINNTVFIDGTSNASCLNLSGLQSGYTQVIANNAFIRGSTSATAVNASLIPGVIVTNNIVRGTGATAGMTTITTPLDQIFINPVDTPGLADLYPAPGSPLISAGANAYAPAIDFNGISRPRGSAVEVGAYEIYGADNPGWQLAIGLKELWLYGDTDGDGSVTVFDVITVVNAFGTVEGDPSWDPTADLDGDGIVDVFDVIDVVINFGAGA